MRSNITLAYDDGGPSRLVRTSGAVYPLQRGHPGRSVNLATSSSLQGTGIGHNNNQAWLDAHSHLPASLVCGRLSRLATPLLYRRIGCGGIKKRPQKEARSIARSHDEPK